MSSGYENIVILSNYRVSNYKNIVIIKYKNI